MNISSSGEFSAQPGDGMKILILGTRIALVGVSLSLGFLGVSLLLTLLGCGDSCSHSLKRALMIQIAGLWTNVGILQLICWVFLRGR